MTRLISCSIVLLLVACATTSPAPQSVPAPAPPDWLSLSGHFETDETPRCEHSRFGVGGVSGMKNPSLRHATAMVRARGDFSERMKQCWSKRLVGKFPLRKDIPDEVPAVSYEMALSQMISTALDAAVVVHTWAPDEETEYLHLEAK